MWRRTSVSATAGQAQDERGQAERLGIKPGQVVQEIGYDDDTSAPSCWDSSHWPGPARKWQSP